MRKAILVVLALTVVAAAAAATLVYKQTQQPYRGYTGVEQSWKFPPAPAPIDWRSTRVRRCDPRLLDLPIALWQSGQARTLKAGGYRFDQPMSPLDVIRKIARGEVYVLSVTFPKGLTIQDMAAIFESMAWVRRLISSRLRRCFTGREA